jgi:hypothetical protein
VEHPDSFVEQIPAFADLQLDPAPSSATDTQTEVVGKRLRLLRLTAKNRLDYTIRLR